MPLLVNRDGNLNTVEPYGLQQLFKFSRTKYETWIVFVTVNSAYRNLLKLRLRCVSGH